MTTDGKNGLGIGNVKLFAWIVISKRDFIEGIRFKKKIPNDGQRVTC